ncbi:MAG: AMP-dependent synthetase [Proteobacteria bacterium]|nr:MAG: AMP-dependent synthetase [Pseudomonadota bacterium]
MPEAKTLFDLLDSGAGGKPAICAPARPALTFAELKRQVRDTVDALNARGIGIGDRVAIVLPNGPEMAVSFISIACGATTAPLNPAYRQEEFEFYLEDLGARALVVEAGSDSHAVAAARVKGIEILEIEHANEDPAGRFRFLGNPNGASPARSGMAAADDIALILHTSGTTSRPKIVPLSHANLARSARNIGQSLALTADDRCMNIMPLFHIHGLVAAILASVGAGGSTYCTPGFNALKFFGWFEEAAPSWYTAVPTMHQAILQRAARSMDVIERHPLRFIRSCSSALPPQVMAELESCFGVPVIEAYAMTEAAHQMTSNPLPPASRKPGTVGVSAGPEVGIMDDEGRLLAAGETGEVVIRGENVTRGYENNPKANEENFTNGWFRTGDQGVLDDEGYLTITGRLKEIINRGGEKISPREVDEVLMDHPAVQQVVTFAMPHAKLGEEIAAAVVLRDDASADEKQIRAFAATRLADFKVPRKIVIPGEIPKGPTGKLQRIGLAEKLGLAP